MSDTDHPLEHIARFEQDTDRSFPDELKTEFLPERAAPLTARERLRAFEDEHLGPDHVRLNDKPERGHGSKFASLSDKHKAIHAALEELVAAEDEHVKAGAAEAAAHARLDAAIKRMAATEEALSRGDEAE